MAEGNRTYELGKVRLVLGRLSDADRWEILKIAVWQDTFEYDLSKAVHDYMLDVLRDDYIMGDEYKAILEEQSLNTEMQLFEIIGTAMEESWKSWTDYGYEYDSRTWLDSVKVREIKDDDLEYFKEEDPFRWKDFTGEEAAIASN